MTGLWVALAAIAVALAFGGYRALTDGRFRGTRVVRGGGLDTASPSGSAYSTNEGTPPASDGGVPGGRAASASERVETPAPAWTLLAEATGTSTPGARATLVQFSSAFCAPCRVTRRVLAEVADVVPGVVHVEIDAEQHLDVVRRLGIVRTPTTLVLDAAGREIARAAGAPRKEQVLAALSGA